MQTQQSDGDGERNPVDDQNSGFEDPFKFFRIGEEQNGTRDLASTELLSVLPGQHYSINEKILRLEFEDPYEPISISLQVDSSPGCGGIVWPAGQVRGLQYHESSLLNSRPIDSIKLSNQERFWIPPWQACSGVRQWDWTRWSDSC